MKYQIQNEDFKIEDGKLIATIKCDSQQIEGVNGVFTHPIESNMFSLKDKCSFNFEPRYVKDQLITIDHTKRWLSYL